MIAFKKFISQSLLESQDIDLTDFNSANYNGMCEQYIYNKITAFLRSPEIAEETGIDMYDVEIALYGSRLRGDQNENSDIDVLVEYHDDTLREDEFFNILNSKNFTIGGLNVDFNPICPEFDSNHTIEHYLEQNNIFSKQNA